jgi:hypothetical protein
MEDKQTKIKDSKPKLRKFKWVFSESGNYFIEVSGNPITLEIKNYEVETSSYEVADYLISQRWEEVF